jgi:hypothetical protein
MVKEATKEAVRCVLSIDSGVSEPLKAAVNALLTNDRKARIPVPQVAVLLGVSKRTMMDRIESGEWPLAIDYDGPTRSFCYIAQVTGLLERVSGDGGRVPGLPTVEELGVSPRGRPGQMNFKKAEKN